MLRIILFVFIIFVSYYPVRAQHATATPKKGEGISAFLERNNRSGRAYRKEFLELNQKRLRGKEQLLLGVRYALPPLKNDKKSSQSLKNTRGNGMKGGGRAIAKENVTDAENTVSEDTLAEERAVGNIGTEDVPEAEVEDVEPAAFRGLQSGKEGVIREPLFGKTLADVKLRGRRLQGACFYVVSGHGGPDPGAIGKVGDAELHEDEYAYDVALRLARNLMEEGAEVRILIQDAKDGIRDGRYLSNSKRETCMGDAIPLNQVARLKQRCTRINALYAKDRKKYTYCRAIFLHVDSRSKGTQTDVFFYHAPQSILGKKLATTMKNTFESKYGKHQPDRGFKGTVSGRNLYVMLNASPTSVFVELGNIQNAFDQRRFVINSNRQALAKWMMEGFIADYMRTKRK